MNDHDILTDVDIILFGYDCLSLEENVLFSDQFSTSIKEKKKPHTVLECIFVMGNNS